MNENLKKALEIAKLGEQLNNYRDLVSISINGWRSSIHLSPHEFLANFPVNDFKDCSSHVKLNVYVDGIEILCILSHSQHFNLQQKGILE